MISKWLIVSSLAIFSVSSLGYANSGQQAKVVQVDSKKGTKIEMKFPSGATIKIPQGVTGTLNSTIASFTIGNDPIEISIAEYQLPIAKALVAAKQELAPIFADQKPVQSVNPPSTSWDAVKIEIFGPDSQKSYTQLQAQQKTTHTWVLVVKGGQKVLAKRQAQLAELYNSLEVPGRSSVDLSQAAQIPLGKRSSQLDAFVTKVMNAADIPGMAIAVVEDGKLAYAAGYGQLGIDDSKAVTPDTMFMIGSTTKPLTTLMMAKQVDQGHFKWSDKVSKVYPSFKLGDGELTAKITMQDLVCACTGIPRHDLPMIYNFDGKTQQDLFSDLRYLKPTTEHKETFQYNNQMVAAGGFIAASRGAAGKASDSAYQQVMTKEVFEPMAMTRTSLDSSAVAKMANVARPHGASLTGKTVRTESRYERFAEYVGPSGGIWSSARDMANFMMTEVNGGIFNGKAVVSKDSLLKRREPQVAISGDSHYALGWMVGKNLGLDAVQHAGGTIGFSSEFVFLPQRKSGIVILSNSNQGGAVFPAITTKLLEIWFNKPLKSAEKLAATLNLIKQQREGAAKLTFAPTAEFMKPFLGKHFNPEMGEIRIERSADKYLLHTSSSTSELIGIDDGKTHKKLLTASAPLVGIAIDPVFKGGKTVNITLAQESYDFKRVAK